MLTIFCRNFCLERRISKAFSRSSNMESTSENSNVYPVKEILSNLMFTYGDSEVPLDGCQLFLLDLLRGQLALLIAKAQNLATIRGKQLIGNVEILFTFRRNPYFIKRLLQYIKILESASTLVSLVDEDKHSADLTVDPALSIRSDFCFNYNTMLDALKEIDVMGEILSVIEASPLNSILPDDNVKMERMRRMAERTKHMDPEYYGKFSAARQASFCGRSGRRLKLMVQKFVEWLGSPPIELGIIYIVNFCAIEIVATMVENATLCREQEAQGVFPQDEPVKSLQLRHYEEALRRNRGYALRKDILFGNFANF